MLLALLGALSPFTAMALHIRENIAIHRVPLRTQDVHSPFCYAVSSPADLNIDPGSKRPINFLATQVWPSARVAAQCLIRFMDSKWTVLEAGCGPGLPSLVAASLGSPQVCATDLEPLALELVAQAGLEQGWQDQIETLELDLTKEATVGTLPRSDLFLLSDVFESREVAEGAARWVDFILEHYEGSRVWVFAQTDRSQREIFLQRLQKMQNNKALEWQDYNNDFVLEDSERLWLCSIDETQVSYG